MMAPLLLALQTAPVPEATPAPDVAQEVLIIGQKLRMWGAQVQFRHDGAHCVIKKSTGDAEIDKIGCDALEKCFRDMWPRYKKNAPLPFAQRRAANDPLNTELTACVKAERGDLIAELAAKRAAAGKPR